MELELKELEEGKKTEQELIDKTIKFVTGIVESNIQIINKDFPCPKCHTGYLFLNVLKTKTPAHSMKSIFAIMIPAKSASRLLMENRKS